jgi:hypothetical protein
VPGGKSEPSHSLLPAEGSRGRLGGELRRGPSAPIRAGARREHAQLIEHSAVPAHVRARSHEAWHRCLVRALPPPPVHALPPLSRVGSSCHSAARVGSSSAPAIVRFCS